MNNGGNERFYVKQDVAYRKKKKNVNLIVVLLLANISIRHFCQSATEVVINVTNCLFTMFIIHLRCVHSN